MQITNRDGWTLSLHDDTFSVIDPNGSVVKDANYIVGGSLANNQEVVEKIQSLSKNVSNAFSFQVYRNDSKIAVWVGSYGLSGGGKYGALAASIAGLVGGVALSFKNKKAGQALIASSFNAAVYAYKTPTENFDDKKCLAKAAIAGTTSLATSTLGDVLKGPIQDVISNPIAAQMVSQGVISLAQEGATQAITGELSLTRMAVSIASTSASVFAGETVNNLMEAKEVSELVFKAGVSGTASASAATVTEDLLTGKSLSNVPAAALSAGILSSINSLPGAFEISDAIKAAEKANNNLPKPPETPKPPEAPKPPTPPKKPEVSHLNIEKRKQEISEREKEVIKQETKYTNAFNNARTRIANLLNAGFHDRAKWCKTAEQSADRMLKGEKVTVRNKDHTIAYKQSPVHKPFNERANLETDKSNLARDVAIVDNSIAGYDASLKAYEANLNAYKQELDNKFTYCPPPPPPAPPVPPLPKMGQLPVMANWHNIPQQIVVRQLVTRPLFVSVNEVQVLHNYQFNSEERIEIAEQAVMGSNEPKIALASQASEKKAERGVVYKAKISQNLETIEGLKIIERLIEKLAEKTEQAVMGSNEPKIASNVEAADEIKRIELLREKLAEKSQAVKIAKNHVAYLQNKKNLAPESARDKKQKLTEQIDAHNKRLENLLKS